MSINRRSLLKGSLAFMLIGGIPAIGMEPIEPTLTDQEVIDTIKLRLQNFFEENLFEILDKDKVAAVVKLDEFNEVLDKHEIAVLEFPDDNATVDVFLRFKGRETFFQLRANVVRTGLEFSKDIASA